MGCRENWLALIATNLADIEFLIREERTILRFQDLFHSLATYLQVYRRTPILSVMH